MLSGYMKNTAHCRLAGVSGMGDAEFAQRIRLLLEVRTYIRPAMPGAAGWGAFHRHKRGVREPASLRRYFIQVVDDHCQIGECLGNRMRIECANSLKPVLSTLAGIGAIFCQNVLVYFSQQQRADILGRVPNPAESMPWPHPDMRRVSCEASLAYYRPVS